MIKDWSSAPECPCDDTGGCILFSNVKSLYGNEAPLFQSLLLSLDELKAAYAEGPSAFGIRFNDKSLREPYAESIPPSCLRFHLYKWFHTVVHPERACHHDRTAIPICARALIAAQCGSSQTGFVNKSGASIRQPVDDREVCSISLTY